MNTPEHAPVRFGAASTLALAALLAACGGGDAQSPAVAPSSSSSTSSSAAPSAVGRWTSACSPMSATQGAVLDFDIGAANWALDYVVFADTTCSSKFMTVRIEGPYAIGAASSSVPSAREVRFGFVRKTVTPHVDAAAQFLSSANGCGQPGFATGTAKDISATGCANLGQRPVSACGADYDLLQVGSDRITFGERPADNDLCAEGKRPKALSKVSSMRK